MHVITEETPGPSVLINCPNCAAMRVAAETCDHRERLTWLFVPVFTWRNTFVTCSNCGKQLVSKWPVEFIADFSAEELTQHLTLRVPLACRVVAVVSILLCWVPLWGLILSLILLPVNLRRTGWVKSLSVLSVVIGAVVTFVGIAVALIVVWLGI